MSTTTNIPHGKKSMNTINSVSLIYICMRTDHYTVHSTLYTLHCTLYTVHCTLYTVQYTRYTVHCTLYTVHCTLCTVHGTLCTVLCTLYTVQYREQSCYQIRWCDQILVKNTNIFLKRKNLQLFIMKQFQIWTSNH